MLEPRFGVRAARIPEDPRDGESPEVCAMRLARAKATAVAARLNGSSRRRTIVLGADTIVALGNRILGKPRDGKEARAMLASLSGKRHRVVTAVALCRGADRKVFAARAITYVRFRRLTRAEIGAYVATREPMDAAGAYQIQGRAASFIRNIDGSYTNVVGFPLGLVARLLGKARGLAPRER
jgi:septum formation protein